MGKRRRNINTFPTGELGPEIRSVVKKEILSKKPISSPCGADRARRLPGAKDVAIANPDTRCPVRD